MLDTRSQEEEVYLMSIFIIISLFFARQEVHFCEVLVMSRQ